MKLPLYHDCLITALYQAVFHIEALTMDYLIPAQEGRAEIEVLNSRFIASLAPVFTVEEAKAFIQRVKFNFAEATHHVPAYLLGHGNRVIAHGHDDGEPSGTAARPMLAVLQGTGLGDVAVVVTRYYGGTKLGTGGLVRAYSDAVKAVLAITPRAKKVAAHWVMVALPYPYFERIERLIAAHEGIILDKAFAVEITLTVQLRVAVYEQFRAELEQMSNGMLVPLIITTNPDTILPI